MADRLTRVRQQTELGEGLAVGCLVVGIAATTSDEALLDTAFRAALQPWPWATRYPAATAGRAAFLGPTLRASVSRSTAVPARRWTTPAEAFVDGLGEGVWRHPPPDLDLGTEHLGLR